MSLDAFLSIAPSPYDHVSSKYRNRRYKVTRPFCPFSPQAFKALLATSPISSTIPLNLITPLIQIQPQRRPRPDSLLRITRRQRNPAKCSDSAAHDSSVRTFLSLRSASISPTSTAIPTHRHLMPASGRPPRTATSGSLQQQRPDDPPNARQSRRPRR